MKMIWRIAFESQIGKESYNVGAESREDALVMAAERGHTGDGVAADKIPNNFGIQPGEWRSAI